jgi:hypothetical protein
MIAVYALLLAGAVTMTPAPSPPGSSTSQAFTDRAARTEARINQDQQQKLLAPGQDALLRVQLGATRRAYAAHDPAAVYMLDVINRQLAEVDHTLTRSDDGQGIIVYVGATVIVAMHDQYVWSIENSDATVLAPKVGVMWARGVQGGFTAKQPGTAILSLTTKAPALARLKQPITFIITILPAKGP